MTRAARCRRWHGCCPDRRRVTVRIPRRRVVPRLLTIFLLPATLLAYSAITPGQGPSPVVPPLASPPAVALEAVRFAVLGDNGTGATPQLDVGRQMAASRRAFGFDFVLMLGDNLYVRANERGYADAFERPYKALLDTGVPFFAILGNHDDVRELTYPR